MAQPGIHPHSSVSRRQRSIDKILPAARKVFGLRGWHGLRREEVGAAGNVAPGTVQRVFPNKRSLAVAAYAPLLHAIIDAASRRLEREEQPEELLREFVYALSRLFAEGPALAIALLSAPHKEPNVECDQLLDETAEVFGRLIGNAGYVNSSAQFAGLYHLNALLAMSTCDAWEHNPDKLAILILERLT